MASILPKPSVNDASCRSSFRTTRPAACGAELVVGRGVEHADFIYFFIGYFIGGGVVLNNAVYSGPGGNAGAFGPMPMPAKKNGSAQRLFDDASIFVLETQLRRQGRDPSCLWHEPNNWAGFDALLDQWIDHTARSLAHAIIASCSVIDFPAAIIDGGFPVHCPPGDRYCHQGSPDPLRPAKSSAAGDPGRLGRRQRSCHRRRSAALFRALPGRPGYPFQISSMTCAMLRAALRKMLGCAEVKDRDATTKSASQQAVLVDRQMLVEAAAAAQAIALQQPAEMAGVGKPRKSSAFRVLGKIWRHRRDPRHVPRDPGWRGSCFAGRVWGWQKHRREGFGRRRSCRPRTSTNSSFDVTMLPGRRTSVPRNFDAPVLL